MNTTLQFRIMNRYLLIGVSLIFISLASCSKRELELDETDPTIVKAITESLIEASATSKSEKEVLWEPGDEIAVFSGELSGKFVSTLKKKPSAGAVFKGELGLESWPEEMDIWAVYPYSEDAFFDGETITTTLPSEQIARDGAFGKDMNLAIAHSNTSTLQFYNVGGGIRFSVTEDGIKKVMFEGLNGEIISGKVKIGFDKEGMPEIQKVTRGSQFITLLPPEGQEAFEKDTWYYIVAIPGSLEKGYKLRLYKDTDYARNIYEKVVTIKRNFYRDLEKVDEGIEYEAQTTHFPETEDEIKESIKTTNSIIKAFNSIHAPFDEFELNGVYIEKVKNIDGVIDAAISENGSCIIVLQKDSVCINFMLNDPTEGLLTKSGNSNIPSSHSSHSISNNSSRIVKEGGKALILAPFQWSFKEDLDKLEDLLDGYFIVEKHINQEATIDQFRGDMLSQYDFIIFSTHGSTGGLNMYLTQGPGIIFDLKAATTLLATATVYNEDALKDICKEAIVKGRQVGIITPKGSNVSYVSMSPRMLNNAAFNNTCIMLNACESAMEIKESRPMVEKMLDKGALIVSGSTVTMNTSIIEEFVTKELSLLNQGCSFQDAFDYLIHSHHLSIFRDEFFNALTSGGEPDYPFIDVDLPNNYVYFVNKKIKDASYLFFQPSIEIDGTPTYGNPVKLTWDCNLSSFKLNWKDSITSFQENGKWIYKPTHSITSDYLVRYDVFIDGSRLGKTLYSDDTKNSTSINLSPGEHTWYVVARIMEGETIITSYQSKEGHFNVTADVIKVKSVSLDKTNIELNVGNTATLKETILPENATNKNVTWTSSDTSIATVSSTGEVKGIAKGTAIITVKTEDGGKTATCRVTVKETKISVTEVSLNMTSLSMTVGDTQTLTATVTPSNATDKSVTWSSNNNTVATVSSSGVVTAKSAGSATITVKTNDGGKTATCSVTVLPNSISVTGVSLDKTSISLAEGETMTLTAIVFPEDATDKSVIWSSGDSSIATVSSTGVVSAKTGGSTTITVRTNDGGKTATCSVTVTIISPSLPVPEVVDLGLSVKWASFNLGATKPEEYGDYYAWGETEPYYSSLDPLTWKPGKETGYDWSSYKWCNNGHQALTKYCDDQYSGYNGFTDGKTVLDPEDDAAHVNLGGRWRIPTGQEMDELVKECTWEWTSRNGVIGRLVTGPNGNSIFLPAAGFRNYKNFSNVQSWGYYWTSRLASSVDLTCRAFTFNFDRSTVYRNGKNRCYGISIRPVYDDK